MRWRGVLGVEGELTGDGRLIERNSLGWDLAGGPLPLRMARVDVGGHDGAVVVGRIDSITRASNGDIQATGDFDTEGEALEAIRLVTEALQDGVSLDLDDVSFEIRVRADLLAQDDDDEGGLLLLAAAGERDQEERETIAEIGSDDEIMALTSGRIRGATLVAMPAFARARIAIESVGDAGATSAAAVEQAAPRSAGIMPDGETACSCTEGDTNYSPECECGSGGTSGPGDAGAGNGGATSADVISLTAGARSSEPPLAWFQQPALTGPTGIVVTDEGRVYGHLATWDTCHVAYSAAGKCITPPRSSTGYAMFRTGLLRTAEGVDIPIGRITMDTRHASRELGVTAALSHYENTGAVVADVAAGEDAYGIWVAGALRPGVNGEKLRSLRASPLSGDWRPVGASLELVAALAVPVAGFPIPRPAGLVAGGRLVSLVAAGMILPDGTSAPGVHAPPSIVAPTDAQRLATRVRASRVAARLRHPSTVR